MNWFDFEDKTFFRFNDIKLYLVMQPITFYNNSCQLLFIGRNLQRDDYWNWWGEYERVLKDHQQNIKKTNVMVTGMESLNIHEVFGFIKSLNDVIDDFFVLSDDIFASQIIKAL